MILVTLWALPFVLFSLLMVTVFFASRDVEKTNKKTIGTLRDLQINKLPSIDSLVRYPPG